ncbi:helix-turn-helix transcriptional regulator [Brucella intermedia]
MPWINKIPSKWGTVHRLSHGAVTRTRTGPNEIKLVAPEAFALVMLSPQPRREIALGTDRPYEFDAPAGELELIPSTADLFARWQVPKENILTSINTERLRGLSGMEFDCEDFELVSPKPGLIDKTAYTIALLIRDELLHKHGPCELVLDSLNVIFWLHILRAHSSHSQTKGDIRHRGGLSSRAWRLVDDYIRTHIAEKPTIENMASIVGLSPGHFLRAFSATTGVTPYQYILEVRLDYAAALIRDKELPLSDVARKAGFASQSHMTAKMTERWKTTPAKLRASVE